MITIYKYPIQIIEAQTVEMPIGAQLLHVGLDPFGNPCIWAKVRNDSDTEDREIHVYGTGHRMNHQSYNHVGSFNQGSFVWHVFSPVKY